MVSRRRAATATVMSTLLLLLAACGSSGSAAARAPTTASSSVRHATLMVQGQVRSYRLFLPAGLDRAKPAPLVVVLHSAGNTGDNAAQITEFDREAATDDFVVAYPDGLEHSWNAGFCCAGAAVQHVDDVGFVTALLDRLEADYAVDASRVYVTGASNGAIMAYRLACDLANRIAGIGSVAGVMTLEDCHPARPVSVLEIHGTADPLVPYQGGKLPQGAVNKDLPVPSSQAVMARWAQLDGCPAAPVVVTQPPVTTSSWTHCRAGTAVKLVAIKGAGHTWYAPGFGPADGAVDATHVIATFFGLTAAAG